MNLAPSAPSTTRWSSERMRFIFLPATVRPFFIRTHSSIPPTPRIAACGGLRMGAKNEEVLNQYLTSLVAMRNLLQALTSHHYIDLPEREKDVLQDTLISISQSEELCRVNVKSIRSLRDSYQIIFTNDVSKTIKRLTAITIILSIPTMVASIYGMNIPLPFQHAVHAFPIVMGCAATICLFAMFLFYKNRWL